MASAWDLFKVIIMVQLIYATSITLLAYGLPSESLTHVDIFSSLAEDIDLDGVSNNIQNNIEDQLDIPVVELGALVFYSGNILLDLMLNFFFAIPQMFGLIVNGFSLLFNIDVFVVATVQVFFTILVTVLYFIGLLQLLMNIRGRGSIV